MNQHKKTLNTFGGICMDSLSNVVLLFNGSWKVTRKTPMHQKAPLMCSWPPDYFHSLIYTPVKGGFSYCLWIFQKWITFFLVTKELFVMKYNDFHRITDFRGVLLLKDCFTLYKYLIPVILTNYCITKALPLKEEERELKHQWQLWIQIQDVLPHRNSPFSSSRIIFQVASTHKSPILTFQRESH